MAAALATVIAVVTTPAHRPWAFALHAVVIGAVVVVLRLPPGATLRRMRVELPFLVFAALLPVVGRGPRVEVGGIPLSEPGLAAAGTLVAKATLGVLVAIVLSSTTPPADLLRGVERLRAPRVMVAIAGFMVRYLDVLAGEAGRMRVARVSRGDDPRWLWQARATAATAGTLFVRAYERGERVHLAMLARGYDGGLPDVRAGEEPAPVSLAVAVLVVPVLAGAVTLGAWLT